MFEMKEWCKQLANAIACNYTDFKNISGQDLEELGKWVDIKKDLAEMEYYETEKLKNISIVEAMEKEATEAPDPEVAGYNHRRYSSGRYAPAGRGHYAGYPYYENDMYGYNDRNGDNTMYDDRSDVHMNNRMGYTDRTGTIGTRSSRYGYMYDEFDKARRNYTNTNTDEDKRQMHDAAGGVVTTAKEMLEKAWQYMEPEEKAKAKNELISSISKMQ